MINKPPLTVKQKETFEQMFRNLMSEVSTELQRKWDGRIGWMPVVDQPIIDQQITKKLPPRLADKYVTLLNKVKGRTI